MGLWLDADSNRVDQSLEAKLGAIFIYSMLLLHLTSGVAAYIADIRHPFTAGKLTARYLAGQDQMRQNIVTLTCDGTMLSPYLENKISFLCSGKKETYCRWEIRNCSRRFTREEITTMLADFVIREGNAFFASSYPILMNDNNFWQPLHQKIKIRRIKKFDQSINGNAVFGVYEIMQVNSTD